MGRLDNRVFLPDFHLDGIGGGYLSPHVSGLSDGIFFLYANQRDDIRLNRARHIMQRRGQNFVREMKIGSKFCVFIPNTFDISREFFRGLGIASYRLVNSQANFILSDSAVSANLQKKVFSDLSISENSILPRFIGINRFNQEVFSTLLGRSFSDKNGKWNADFERVGNDLSKGEISPEAFFRAVDKHTFDNCARNVAYMFATGRFLNTKNFFSLYSDVVSTLPDNIRDNADFRMFAFQENIEAHLTDFFVAINKKKSDARSNALALDETLVSHADRDGIRSVMQQFSTPFPIAQIAFETTIPTAGSRVLEPTVGNGVLISPFLGRNVELELIELDKNRASRANFLSEKYNNKKVIVGDTLEKLKDISDDIDIVIANPPFETLKKERVVVDRNGTKITIRSLDHLIAFNALEKLKDNGRAFIILPAEMIEKGRLKGSKRFWDNYLRATYNVAGSACVDGRLFRKMGAQFPTLIYAIAGRRSKPLTAEEIRAEEVEELPLLKSFTEVFNWADLTRQKVLEMCPFLNKQEIAQWLDTSRPQLRPTVRSDLQPIKNPQQSSDKEIAEDKNRLASSEDGKIPAKNSHRRKSAKQINKVNDEIEDEVETETQKNDVETKEPALDNQNNQTSPYLELVDDLADNPLLSAYSSYSSVGTPTTRIQKALESGTYRALAEVEGKHGNIDDYVSKKLNLSVEQLAERFSPEQVDGAALAFSRMDEGKGFLFSDLMGVGKGRELAMMTLSAFAGDRPVIFWTEQPNLFTDFVARDIPRAFGLSSAEIKKQGIFHPFIFNQGAEARVIDNDTLDVLYPTGDINEAKKDGIPASVNFVLSTYSQVQTAQGSWKAVAMEKWLEDKAEEGKAPLLILDECHKAAGENSRTGVVIQGLVKTVKKLHGNVIYSSATPLKSAKNIRIFSDILPETEFSTDNLIDLIAASPVALQEVLATEMARMGSTISREIDTSGVTRRFVSTIDIDPVRHKKITKNLDVVAEFLSELINTAERVDEVGKAMGSQYAGGSNGVGAGIKVDVTTTSPVSQFHNLSQYMMSASKTAFAEELILNAIADGTKPVIVVENTGNDILRRFCERQGTSDIIDGKAVQIIDRLPNIGDALIEIANKLLNVRITNALGQETSERLEQNGLGEWLEDFEQRVEKANLRELTISPIDKIIEIANKHDLSVGEITKRNLSARKLDDGRYVVAKRDIPDKRDIVRNFNNGLTDIVIMNRAAATGISMHCSPAVGCDLRPRRMIKLQLQSEITAETQINGRIQRFGQIHDAQYDIPLMGLAADDRLCQLFNKKNRSLSATSSGIRENKNNISEASDLLNAVGDEVVGEYLKSNEKLAKNLGIDVKSDNTDYARKLMGRLVCLPVASQEAILSDIDTNFKMQIEVLNSRGLNPLKLSNFDWRAKVEPVDELVTGDKATESVGKMPVILNKVTYNDNVIPITFETVLNAIKRGEENLVDNLTRRVVLPSEIVGKLFNEDNTVNWDNNFWDKALGRRSIDVSLGITPVSLDKANIIFQEYRDGKEGSSVDEKRIEKALDFAIFLKNQLGRMDVGNFIHIPIKLAPNLEKCEIVDRLREAFPKAGDNLKVPAVITQINFNEEDLTNIANWKITVAVLGEKATTTLSFTTFYGLWNSLSGEEKLKFGEIIDPVVYNRVPVLFSPTGQFLSVDDDEDIKLKTFYFSDIHKEEIEKINLKPDDLRELNITKNPRLFEYVKKCFDLAPAGIISRTRYTLEGNLFKACAMGDPRQKIAYTTNDGELHNAVLLPRNVKENELIVTMKEKAGNLTICLPKMSHLELERFIKAMITLDGCVMIFGGDFNKFDEFAKENLISSVCHLIDYFSEKTGICDSDHTKNIQKIRNFVEKNIDIVANDFINCFDKISRPTEFFVGNDLFRGSEKTFRNYFSKSDNKIETRVSSYADYIGAINKNEIDAVRLINSGQEYCFVFNKKNPFFTEELLTSDSEVESVMRRSGNKFSDIGRLVKGNLSFNFSGKSRYIVAPVINLFVKIAENSDNPVLVSGANVKIIRTIEKYQPLIFTPTQQLDNDVELDANEKIPSC